MEPEASGDLLVFERSLFADGGIFIVMNAFTLLRKLFSMQTKPSSLKGNLVKGKMTKSPQDIEGVEGRRTVKAPSYAAMNRYWVIIFWEEWAPFCCALNG
jgi:hypothetical protein